MRTISLLLLLAVAAFSLPSLCADAPRSEVFDRTVPLAAGGRFELENVNGSITITGWDRDAVEVQAVKTAALPDANLAEVRIDLHAEPERVAVATVYPQEESIEVAVEYSVRVPRHVLLQQVSTVNGSVRVTGVAAQGALRAVNGNIQMSDSAGAFTARTTNGDVHLELTRLAPAGTLAIETVNGSVVLAIPRDSSATFDVRSVNGDFRSELPLVVASAYKPREFHGHLGTGGPAVQLRTVNGAIRVTSLPEGI